MHPEMRDPPQEPIPFPVLYQEERFVKSFDRANYLSRQAASALYLMRLYREWLVSSRKSPCDTPEWNWSMALVGPLMHLIHVHEMQAAELHGEVSERESWYLGEMYRRMNAKPRDHAVRLAIHGVMYLRGLYRYRQVIEWSSISHPWTLWARDAELNAKLCFDVLYDLEFLVTAKRLVVEAVSVEEEVMKEIEARKKSQYMPSVSRV